MRYSTDLHRILNFLGVLAMVGVLLGSFAYQFIYRELPCTLCLLQRLAMMGVAFGAAKNLMLGPDPRHYGVCIISAIFGLAVSIRQATLHINPFFDKTTGLPTLDATANPAFGQAVFGLHLYIWGIVLFSMVIFAAGVMLLFARRDEDAETPQTLRGLATFGVALLFVVYLLQTGQTFAECGFGDCPNDGKWNWWLFG